MAYSELVKNFNRIRDYMREFYVYGFKSRSEYDARSARSYDDERRRIESWLGDYMRFVQTSEGKNVFLTVDSRVTSKNPFYKAWKAKSFTDGDITLHFILFDILYSPEISLPISEITRIIDEDYMQSFKKPLRSYVEITVLIPTILQEGDRLHPGMLGTFSCPQGLEEGLEEGPEEEGLS